MASAFSICALAVKWSTSGPSEETEQVGIPADDPVWYDNLTKETSRGSSRATIINRADLNL